MDCNDNRFIDLHIHSTASDGTLGPLEIIDAARAGGLSAISITDHDTTDGCKAVLGQSSSPPMDFLSGVEISTAMPPGEWPAGSLHILGYDIDVFDPSLNRCLSDLRSARNNRSPKIIKKLNELGFKLQLDDIKPFSKGSQVGRPHIAQAMLHKEYVSSINEAFDKYIGRHGMAYIDKERIPCRDAIELINNSGGIPVLAHPGLIDLDSPTALEDLLELLVKEGIKGIEAYYSGHTREQTGFFVDLSQRHGLLLTGGSDFHGALNPEIALGKGTGDLFVGYHLYQRLLASQRQKKQKR